MRTIPTGRTRKRYISGGVLDALQKGFGGVRELLHHQTPFHARFTVDALVCVVHYLSNTSLILSRGHSY